MSPQVSQVPQNQKDSKQTPPESSLHQTKKTRDFVTEKNGQKPEVVEECVAKLEQLRAKVPADLVEEVHRRSIR